MVRLAFVFLFVSIFCDNVYSQQTGHNLTLQTPVATPVYFDRVDSGQYVFYFDQFYYLSDKTCQFTAIERYTSFDFVGNMFQGEFMDYDHQGRLILTGNYSNGRKEGVFKAYHTNGQLKWETTYLQDFPDGEARYYYPDGKPMLTVFHGERGIEIKDYWDRVGQRRVRDGHGRYSMLVELDGYSEYGATFIQRQGRIRQGKPDGVWALNFTYANGDSQYIGSERYDAGRPQVNQNEDLYELLPGESKMSILPLNWFHRAELLISKMCSIDEHLGFSRYLEQFLDNAFTGQISYFPDNAQFELELSITEAGILRRVAEMEPSRPEYVQMVSRVLTLVPYWIPSWKDDEYIADTLYLNIEIMRDEDSASPRFFIRSILRESGG